MTGFLKGKIIKIEILSFLPSSLPFTHPPGLAVSTEDSLRLELENLMWSVTARHDKTFKIINRAL